MRAHPLSLLALAAFAALPTACGGGAAHPRAPLITRPASAIQQVALTAAEVGAAYSPAPDQTRGTVDPSLASGCGADLLAETNRVNAANPRPFGYSTLLDAAADSTVQSEVDDLGTATAAQQQNADQERLTLACPTYAQRNGSASATVADAAGTFTTAGALGSITTVTSGTESVVATYEALAVGRYLLSVSIYAPARAEAQTDALMTTMVRKAATLPG